MRRPKGERPLGDRLRRLFWSWWVWALAAVVCARMDHWGWAIGTAIMAFVTHLIAPRETSPKYGLDHEFSIDSDEFCTTLVGATGVPYLKGNSLTVYNNGDEFYPVMLEAVQAAEESVTVEAYIYWAGWTGETFARALAEKCREGVSVKLLLDAIGAADIGDHILRILDESGCQIAWFNPLRWYSLGQYNNRTHRKSLIIDGRVAFTGGAGIADHWWGKAQDSHHWRDIQIRIEGPSVIPLQTGFAQNWLNTTGELITGTEYYPPPAEAGDVELQTILSSPTTGASSVRIMYYFAIVCSRQRIYIANPYFVPDQTAIDTLIEAKQRGVDVKIMVAGRYNDNQMVRRSATRLYGTLMEGGVEIYEYNRTMLHHKIMVVDGTWATVGTTNFDSRSFAHNEENNVCFFDPASVQRLERIFEEDLQHCDRVTLEVWRRRGMWARSAELLCSMLKDQM
jgi:cardiolipin synthase